MKNSSFLYAILLVSACSNPDAKLKDLQAENDSLRNIINERSWCFSREQPMSPYPSLSDAAAATERWRNHTAKNVMIPASWRFDVKDFIAELQENDIKYFRFYPSLVPTRDTMNLLFVSVDSKGDDNLGTETAPRVYNFSQNCPSMCSKKNVINDREPNDCIFVTAMKQDKK